MTPNHAQRPLCETCSNCTFIRGFAESETRVHCSMMGRTNNIVPFPVYECSSYELRQSIELHDLWRMATMIDKKEDGTIGFTRPKPRNQLYDIE